MRKWVVSILELQKLDMRLKKMRQKLAELPDERKYAMADANSAKTALDDAKKHMKESELALKNAENERKHLEDKKLKLSTQSLSVKKNEEYKAILSEIERCQAEIDAAETCELLAMDALDACRKAAKKADDAVSASKKELEERLAEIASLQDDLTRRMAVISEDRPTLVAAIEPDALVLYERLVKGLGEPLTPARAGVCGHCHLKLTMQDINNARNEDVATCSNCGHMIYIEYDD